MSDTVIRVENISKLYRLGEVGTGSLAHDVNRWWHRVRWKEDPYLKIGEVNDRTKSVSSVQRPESSAKKTNALAPQPSYLDSTPSSSSRPLDPGLSIPSSSALDSRLSTLDSRLSTLDSRLSTPRLRRRTGSTRAEGCFVRGDARGIEDLGTVRKRDFEEMPWFNQGAGLREETASTAGADWA